MCLFTNKLFLRHSKSKISWFEKSISNDDKKKKTFHVYLFWSENKKREKKNIANSIPYRILLIVRKMC